MLAQISNQPSLNAQNAQPWGRLASAAAEGHTGRHPCQPTGQECEAPFFFSSPKQQKSGESVSRLVSDSKFRWKGQNLAWIPSCLPWMRRNAAAAVSMVYFQGALWTLWRQESVENLLWAAFFLLMATSWVTLSCPYGPKSLRNVSNQEEFRQFLQAHSVQCSTSRCVHWQWPVAVWPEKLVYKNLNTSC